MKRAAFLDRDGVINKKAPDEGYILRPEDLEILPHVADAISRLNQADFLVVVVTNQRCVAKGLLTIDRLREIHDHMQIELGAAGARIDAIYYCPHGRDMSCECRKPAPGMLLEASTELKIDLQQSWMIGDTISDIAAGKSAGCRTILITATGENPVRADATADSLFSAAKHILSAD